MAEDDALTEADDDEGPEEREPRDRKEELSRRAGVKTSLLKLYADIEKGFTDQNGRANDTMDYWDVYNCQLTSKQFYNGRSQIFVPAVHNAINARKTRFTNQIFPVSGRYVEVTTEDGTIPHSLVALAEYYVQKAKLRTKVMPALMRNGDIEGQYNLYITWEEYDRHVAYRVKKPVKLTDENGAEMEGDEDEIDDIEEETVESGCPHVEVLSDTDVLVLPATADSIEDALNDGGSVTVIRRWRTAKIKSLIRAGQIVKSEGDALCAEMSKNETIDQQTNKAKRMTDAAGIKGSGTDKFALIYETWTKLTIAGERRLCRAYFGGGTQLLGCKRNPFWSDCLPIISAPVEKVQGSFKGQSKVKPVADLQYQANDAVNEAMDSAAYALMPIVMTDPVKNPRIGSMILSMSAIWETNPNDTKFAEFPALWKDGMEIVSAAKAEIMQTLGVNPAMITQVPQASKMNQAQIAAEQQVEILTTADAVTVVEEAILTPLINRFIELDHQYRDEDLTVRQYGAMGMRASIEKIPPIAFDKRYHFRWFGVESARNAQQVQQQIAGMNVLRGIPPEQLNGYQLNMVPIITQFVENTFGPRLAPLVFVSPEQQMPVPIEQEHELLQAGFEVPTHAMDDDNAHIQAHLQLMQFAQASENIPGGVVKKIQAHIFAHMQQAQRKQAMAAQQQLGLVGAPGGAGPGIAGTPRPGSIPAQPRGGQGPPGMIHQDQMQDPAVMPRKM